MADVWPLESLRQSLVLDLSGSLPPTAPPGSCNNTTYTGEGGQATAPTLQRLTQGTVREDTKCDDGDQSCKTSRLCRASSTRLFASSCRHHARDDADNIETSSVLALFQKFHSPVLAGSRISAFGRLPLFSVYFGGLPNRTICEKSRAVAQVPFHECIGAWPYSFTNSIFRSGMRPFC